MIEHSIPPRRRTIPATAHATRSALRRTTALIVAAGFCALAIALAAGHWAGSAAAPEPAVSGPGQRTVQAGRAEVSLPRRWATVPIKSAGIDGLDAARTTVLAPSPGLTSRALVMLAPVADASLVPAVLRAVVSGPLPTPRRTRLAGRAAWLYPELTLTGEREMDLTVLPTSAGVLAAACVAPRFAWSAAVGCAGAIERVSVSGAAIFTPAPNLIFRLRLPAVVAALDRVRVSDREALRDARTRPGQARIAAHLARAHRVAVAAVRPLAADQGAPLLLALRATATAYDRLAAAAAHGWPARYRASRLAVARADARLKQALHDLEIAGA